MKNSKIKLLFAGLIIAFGATTQAKDTSLKSIPKEFQGYWEPVNCTENNCSIGFSLEKDSGIIADGICPGPLKKVTLSELGDVRKLVVTAVEMDIECQKSSRRNVTNTLELKGKYLYLYEGKQKVGPYKRMKQ